MKALPYRHICIEGNIGSGKTSLVEKLSVDYNGHKILEQFEDNPFLPLFYKNPERYAFTVELFFMTERFKQMQNSIAGPDLFTNHMFSDFCFIKTLLFARKNLEKEEYKLFQMLFTVLNKSFPNPDLLVYIHRDVKYLLENIKSRGRHYESDITAKYLQSIQDSYFEYLRNITSFPVLILDLKGIDFVANKQNYETIKFLISKEYNPGVHRVSVSM
ncbi:MAG: deoxynucleoside kinase [Saprospiraceae bacterium]|nr:deoxynucleoside kinase [Bacteroidia bacterium]NNE13884.1 deoxynucleoside kinase [Saprospiraceae bacterium]NNL92706.1 deoxynucleoside kinase [Saprospiraceae bacterium]